MKKIRAILLLVVSTVLIIDMHFTHAVSSFGDDYATLSTLLGTFGYWGLVGTLLFGFIIPTLTNKAERNPIAVIIEENALTVNGVRSIAPFSADGSLITQTAVFEQTLRHAVNAAIPPSFISLKPAAKVTVLLGGRSGLSDQDAERIDAVIHDMFMTAQVRVGSVV